MPLDPSTSATLSAVWLTAAILAGGFARTRNRSAWNRFLLTLVLGPLAAAMLVIWPAREAVPDLSAPTPGFDGERTPR